MSRVYNINNSNDNPPMNSRAAIEEQNRKVLETDMYSMNEILELERCGCVAETVHPTFPTYLQLSVLEGGLSMRTQFLRCRKCDRVLETDQDFANHNVTCSRDAKMRAKNNKKKVPKILRRSTAPGEASTSQVDDIVQSREEDIRMARMSEEMAPASASLFTTSRAPYRLKVKPIRKQNLSRDSPTSPSPQPTSSESSRLSGTSSNDRVVTISVVSLKTQTSSDDVDGPPPPVQTKTPSSSKPSPKPSENVSSRPKLVPLAPKPAPSTSQQKPSEPKKVVVPVPSNPKVFAAQWKPLERRVLPIVIPAGHRLRGDPNAGGPPDLGPPQVARKRAAAPNLGSPQVDPRKNIHLLQRILSQSASKRATYCVLKHIGSGTFSVEPTYVPSMLNLDNKKMFYKTTNLRLAYVVRSMAELLNMEMRKDIERYDESLLDERRLRLAQQLRTFVDLRNAAEPNAKRRNREDDAAISAARQATIAEEDFVFSNRYDEEMEDDQEDLFGRTQGYHEDQEYGAEHDHLKEVMEEGEEQDPMSNMISFSNDTNSSSPSLGSLTSDNKDDLDLIINDGSLTAYFEHRRQPSPKVEEKQDEIKEELVDEVTAPITEVHLPQTDDVKHDDLLFSNSDPLSQLDIRAARPPKETIAVELNGKRPRRNCRSSWARHRDADEGTSFKRTGQPQDRMDEDDGVASTSTRRSKRGR